MFFSYHNEFRWITLNGPLLSHFFKQAKKHIILKQEVWPKLESMINVLLQNDQALKTSSGKWLWYLLIKEADCCAPTPGLREAEGRPGRLHFLLSPLPRTHVAMGPRILGCFVTCFVCSWTFFQVSECGFTSLFLIAECYRCSLIYFTDFLWWTFRSIPISSKINNVVMNIIVLISFFDLFNSSHWIYQNQMWL